MSDSSATIIFRCQNCLSDVEHVPNNFAAPVASVPLTVTLSNNWPDYLDDIRAMLPLNGSDTTTLDLNVTNARVQNYEEMLVIAGFAK
jgi:hypothetical protein